MAKTIIAGLTVTIGANTDDFQKKIKEIDRESKNIAKDLKTVSESMKLDPTAIQTYSDKFKLLQEAVDKSKEKVNLAKDAIEALNKDLAEKKVSPEDYAKSMKALTRQLESAEYEYEQNLSALRDYDKATKDATENIKDYDDKTGKASEEQDKLTENIKKTNKAYLVYYERTSDASRGEEEITENVEDYRKEADKAAESTKNLGDIIKGNIIAQVVMKGFEKLVNFAKSLAKHLVDAAKKLASFAVSSVELAAQYQDAVETSKRAFGEFATDAVKFANDQSVALGLYKGDMLEAMNSLGLMFTSLGLTKDQAVVMSEKVVLLAADLRAAFGGDMGEILDALSRGFSTSTRNLRQFGVYISEAEIKAYALAKGIVQTTVDQTKLNRALIDCEKAENNLQKAIAKYGEESLEAKDAEQALIEKTEKLNEVMAGEADAMSSAERETALLGLTQDRLNAIQGQANAESKKYPALINRIAAAFKNMKEEIGERLLPIFEKWLTKFLDFLQSDEGQQTMNAIANAFEKIGEKIDEMLEDGTLKEMINLFIEKAPDIVTKLGEILTKVIDLSPKIFELTEKLLNLFGIETEASKAKKAYKDVKDEVVDMAEKYGTSTEAMRTAIALFAQENGINVSDIYSDWSTYAPLIESYVSDVSKEYKDNLTDKAYDTISNFASDNLVSLQEIYNNWSYWEPQITEYAGSLEDGYDQKFSKTIGYIQQFATDNGLSLGDILSDWTTYEPQIDTWMGTLETDASDLEAAYKEKMDQLPSDAQTAVNKFAGIDWTSADSFHEKVRGWAHSIVGFFKDVIGWFNDAKSLDISEVPTDPGVPDWRYGEDSWDPYDPFGGGVYVPENVSSVASGGVHNSTVNNNNSRSTGDINIYVNSYGMNVEEVADELGAAFANKIRMSGAMI